MSSFRLFACLSQVTRLLPDAVGTTCGQRLEKVLGTEHTHILRVPFRTEKGILRKWISRFEVWPYLETYADVHLHFILFFLLQQFIETYIAISDFSVFFS